MTEVSIANMLHFWESQQPDNQDSKLHPTQAILILVRQIDELQNSYESPGPDITFGQYVDLVNEFETDYQNAYKDYNLKRIGSLFAALTPFNSEQRQHVDYVIGWARSIETHRHEIIKFLDGMADKADPLEQFENRPPFPKKPTFN